MAIKQKIMFAGASGYGNLGDDFYKYIFDKYLSDEFELIFDSPYPDIRYMDQVDYLVIGGGGLIYDNDTDHFYYMQKYLDMAIEKGIPFFFISCGIQIRTPTFREDLANQDYKKLAASLVNWKPYLEKAELITIRSAVDGKVLEELSDNINPIVLPDLGYLIEPSNYQIADNIETVIIPNKQLYGFEEYLAEIQQYINEKTYLLALSSEDNYIIMQLCTRLQIHSMLNDRRIVTPFEAARMIKDCKQIITSRYHGLVFARAMGKGEDEITKLMNNYKGLSETKPLCSLVADDNINYLKNKIKEIKNGK